MLSLLKPDIVSEVGHKAGYVWGYVWGVNTAIIRDARFSYLGCVITLQFCNSYASTIAPVPYQAIVTCLPRVYTYIHETHNTCVYGRRVSFPLSASSNLAVRPVRSDHAEIPKNSVLLDCPMLGIVSGMWWGQVHE